jgi:hypothetical protein
MKNPRPARDDQHEVSRRALIKWSLAAGAALGVSRSDIFGILERAAGKDTAFAAAENPTRRSVSLIAGTGSLAWFTLLWPQADIALAANPALSWHKPGMATTVGGTRNLVIGPDTPFATMPAARQMTCFTAGENQTHRKNPDLAANLNGNNIYSVIASLQSASPSIIPFVSVETGRGGGQQTDVGTAPGAPPVSRVANAAGISDLFNSAASRATGILAKPSNAQLYRAQYEAFAQLNRASNRSTTKSAYQTASAAAGFLGTNLSTKLATTPADLARYGVDGGMPDTVADIARIFIIAVKSFKLGLTNAIVAPIMNDDPHTAFTAGGINIVPPKLKQVFDAFMADLTSTTDDVTGKSLADDTVLTITGDTPKSCVVPRGGAGWDDGSPASHNVVYVYSAGDLKSGWFGGVSRAGAVTGFDPQGKPAAYNTATTMRLALSSIAYSIAKRDDRTITNFTNNTPISDIFGNPKQT